MIGRDQERSRILRLLDEAAGGAGDAVLVRGASGVGKTMLVEDGLAAATERGFAVLSCVGSQSETQLSLAGLHQLLHDAVDRAAGLPDRQRDAFLSVFGLGADTAPDRLLVSLAALGIIDDLARERPVLIVVDDVQWIDEPTLNIIGFVARRIATTRVAILLTLRDEHGDPVALRALPEMVLPALTGDAAAMLLDQLHPALDRRLKARVLEEAEGNPLALVELSRGALERPLDGADRLPLTIRMEQAFAAQVNALPTPVRELLLIAAINAEPSLDEWERAGIALGIPPATRAQAEESGLIRVSGGELRFRHPLVRSAIYGTAAPHGRTAAHRALADALHGDRAAWHHAAATTGPDEEVAAALVDAAEGARSRGNLGDVMRFLERAAELSPDPVAAGRRLAAACEAAQFAGLTDAALRLSALTTKTTDDPIALVRLAHTRASLAYTVVPTVLDPVELTAIARRALPLDPEIAGSCMVNASTWFSAEGALRADVMPIVEDGLRALALPEDSLPIVLARANLDPQRFAATSLPVIRAAMEHIAVLPPVAHMALAMSSQPLHDWPTVTTYALAAKDAEERVGAVANFTSSLSLLGFSLIVRGRLADGLAEAERGHRLAADLELSVTMAYSAGSIAHAYAWYGDATATEKALQVGRELGPAQRGDMRSLQEWSTGLLALGQGRYWDAYVALQSAVSAHRDFGLLAIADLVEAACRAGYADQVAERLAAAERLAEPVDAPLLRHLVYRSRALLGDEPDSHFRLALAEDGYPLQTARTRLVYGEWLRRQRRIASARDELAKALSVFDQAGAAPWAERARTELRASGVTTVPSATASAVANLTAQELQIAQLAAKGLSNKDIADQLFLSHRTVGSHLYRAFPKLGITVRAELRDALARLFPNTA